MRPVPRLYDQAEAEEIVLRNRSHRIVFALAALILSFCGVAQAEQEVFRWTDENGVTHFSDRPTDSRAQPTGMVYRNTDPQELQKRLMREEYQESQEAVVEAEQAEEAAAEATRRAEEAKTRDLQCNAARERLQVYTTAPRLYESLPGGERRYLTDDELTAAREQAKADVEQWCD